ncbi:MAG: hypothetical protein IH964_13135 [Candidatus Dadabacteria bacterium]|nr:hypothetical protein [Candidatus Dadabacteria bacterium]
MHSLLYKFVLVVVLALVPYNLFAQKTGDEGIFVSDTKVINTSIVSIEPKERIVVLKDKDGELYPIKVVEEIIDFDKIEVGDKVRLEYYEKFEVSLADPDEKMGVIVDSKLSVSSSIKQMTTGEDIYEDISVIEEIDIGNRVVTLKSADGESLTLKVENSVKGLEKLKIGDKIKSIYTRKVTISLEKP